MTASFWLTASQTVVFLAVCGFAWWASRLIAEAANNSARAAQQAVKAAHDAERTAADMREMRDMLRTWLEHQQAHVDRLHEQPQSGPVPTHLVRTDTAETLAVITPQAITGGSDSTRAGENAPGDASRSRRGRHASDIDPSWTSALRAVASRTASRIKPPEE